LIGKLARLRIYVHLKTIAKGVLALAGLSRAGAAEPPSSPIGLFNRIPELPPAA